MVWLCNGLERCFGCNHIFFSSTHQIEDGDLKHFVCDECVELWQPDRMANDRSLQDVLQGVYFQ